MRTASAAMALAVSLAAAATARAEGGAADERFARGRVHAGASAGWGQGFEPWGDKDDVRMAAAVPHVGVGLTDPLGGDAWFRGNVDLSLEGQGFADFQGEDGLAGGAALFLRYHFLGREAGERRLVPFVGVGGGLLALDFDGQHQDDGFSFVFQAGGGAHLLVGRNAALTFDARWHHISNAGLRSPNNGIESALFLLGVTWFLP